VSAAAEALFGPGCLALVVGPSGAGKDTLLAIAARRLADERRIVFGRRIVTREADSSEDHDTMSVDAYEAALAGGAFTLAWGAHGLFYGVPREAINRVEAGETVVYNASRKAIEPARAQFARVRIIYVTAPPEILASRLAARGRDGDIRARLARGEAIERSREADIVIENVGDPEVTGGRLAGFLKETLA
jgi:ribose 1,5-bisphosphokinase